MIRTILGLTLSFYYYFFQFICHQMQLLTLVICSVLNNN